MSYPQTCKDEAKSEGVPMCDYKRCVAMQKRIDAACHNRGWAPGSPYYLDNPDGSVCACCCSCFAENTPIAVNANAFKLIQDFAPGDVIYTADKNLNWTERKVEFVTNPAGDQTKAFMVLINYGSGENAASISVTEDHLFLTPDRLLIPALALTTNDKLVAPDGSNVDISMVVSVQIEDGIYQLVSNAPTASMDGHLLNSNGVVSADFALQAGYIAGQLDKSMIAAGVSKRLKVGSPEYQAKHYNEAAKAFCSDPTLWPKGLTAFTMNTLYNVPPTARQYMTDAQAIDIMENPDAETRPHDSNSAIQMIEYLWSTFRAFFPKPLYVMDWNREEPNAYAWSTPGQDYIMITGGLLRQYAMNQDGLAIVLTHCLANLYGADPGYDNQKAICTGPADYDGIVTYFGTIYRNQDFFNKFKAGLAQLEKLWSYISDKNRQGNPDDKCFDPGIDCRIETLQFATYLFPMPDCANPHITGFEVTGASAKEGEGTVKVTFSQKVNTDTANTLANYSLMPETAITKARVKRLDHKTVILDADVVVDKQYRLTVSEVLSENNQPLDKNTAIFTVTPAAAGKKGGKK
jgi:hypothetical protein